MNARMFAQLTFLYMEMKNQIQLIRIIYFLVSFELISRFGHTPPRCPFADKSMLSIFLFSPLVSIAWVWYGRGVQNGERCTFSMPRAKVFVRSSDVCDGRLSIYNALVRTWCGRNSAKCFICSFVNTHFKCINVRFTNRLLTDKKIISRPTTKVA